MERTVQEFSDSFANDGFDGWSLNAAFSYDLPGKSLVRSPSPLFTSYLKNDVYAHALTKKQALKASYITNPINRLFVRRVNTIVMLIINRPSSSVVLESFPDMLEQIQVT